MSKAPQLGKSLGKVSIQGVESLPPSSSWLLPGCKNTPIEVENSASKLIEFMK